MTDGCNSKMDIGGFGRGGGECHIVRSGREMEERIQR